LKTERLQSTAESAIVDQPSCSPDQKAVGRIFKLAGFANSESVHRGAWRAILADQMAIARFSSLDRRMLELEDVVQAQSDSGCPVSG
jgi:hypothetical protein